MGRAFSLLYYKDMFHFFGKTKARNIAVVDVNSLSVGAAFATISGIAPPAIVFSTRIKNRVPHTGAPGMLRALDEVAKDMIEKGAPLLKTITGSGSVENATILLSSPWQASTLHVHGITKEKPFIFTEDMLHTKELDAVPRGCSTTLIASILNGYEVDRPIGKRATKAEVVLMSNCIDQEIEPSVKRAVRSFVGAAPLQFVSFPSAAHLVLQGLFPHERDFLAFSIGNEATEIAFVKQGHLTGIETVMVGALSFSEAAREEGVVSSSGVVDLEKGLIDREKNNRLSKRMGEAEAVWIKEVKEALIRIASEGALPRVLFLFCDSVMLTFFKRLLNTPELHALWLSDEPLSLMTIGPRQFSLFMRPISNTPDDPILDMIALITRVKEQGDWRYLGT